MNNKSIMNRLRRFIQRHAIQNLSLIIILCYGFGYLLEFVNSSFLDYLTLNPYAICHGQIWRLLTWVLVPPSSSNIFYILIAMLFYYSIGTALEKTWGTYNYNVYIFEGVFITILGAFLVMIISYILYGGALSGEVASAYFRVVARYYTTYYIYMSIFLAYAATFPNAVVLFMFILPIKVKWLGIVYGVMLAFDFITTAMSGYWYICIAMVASLANFAIFIFQSKKLNRFNPKEIRRRNEFKKAMSRGEKKNKSNGAFGGRFSGASSNQASAAASQSGGPAPAPKMRTREQARHRCAICGRTDADDPTLEFRYCSKCEGNYEFCQDHLFLHLHAVNGSEPIRSN